MRKREREKGRSDLLLLPSHCHCVCVCALALVPVDATKQCTVLAALSVRDCVSVSVARKEDGHEGALPACIHVYLSLAAHICSSVC